MNRLSIAQLEQFSGIKAHTIRIWEQRYQALTPDRSEGNTRIYDSSQLRRLLNIVSLMNAGYKVSELCLMPDEKMFSILDDQIKNDLTLEVTIEYFVSQLIAAGMTYDERYFEKIFYNCILRYGLKDAYVKVIYPMLVRIGLMWASNAMPPAQEHFISNLVRQKLYSAIDALPPAKPSRNLWLLFLPEDEFHETGLLFSNYLIRLYGKEVIYLGSNVPLDTLKNAVRQTSPSHLLFFLVHHDLPEKAQQYLSALGKSFIKPKIFLGGNQDIISKIKTGKSMRILKSVDDLAAAAS